MLGYIKNLFWSEENNSSALIESNITLKLNTAKTQLMPDGIGRYAIEPRLTDDAKMPREKNYPQMQAQLASYIHAIGTNRQSEKAEKTRTARFKEHQVQSRIDELTTEKNKTLKPAEKLNFDSKFASDLEQQLKIDPTDRNFATKRKSERYEAMEASLGLKVKRLEHRSLIVELKKQMQAGEARKKAALHDKPELDEELTQIKNSRSGFNKDAFQGLLTAAYASNPHILHHKNQANISKMVEVAEKIEAHGPTLP